MMFENLVVKRNSEFLESILFYISGFIVSKLVKLRTCSVCRNCLVSSSRPACSSDHDYCGAKSLVYSDVSSASALTHFVNRGGLQIPSPSVFYIVKHSEQVFKAYVSKNGKQIGCGSNLRSRRLLEVCHHFILDQHHHRIFEDHEEPMKSGLKTTTK